MHLHFTVVQASNTDMPQNSHTCIPCTLQSVSCDSVVILSQLELQSAMCVLYQPVMTAECKAGGTEMLGATCGHVVLYSQMLSGQPWDRTQASVLGGLSYCIPEL